MLADIEGRLRHRVVQIEHMEIRKITENCSGKSLSFGMIALTEQSEVTAAQKKKKKRIVSHGLRKPLWRGRGLRKETKKQWKRSTVRNSEQGDLVHDAVSVAC